MTSEQTTNRWAVLAALFAARLTMALQYQAVAAVSPLYLDGYGATLADVGALIGIYLAPGVLIAIPGGSLGHRFGDRNAILAGMGLMIAGAVLMALGDSWSAQMAGRLLAGIGGVVLNVLMTKVVADTFSGRELATAMGIFVNSWPVGIAVALIVLPWIGGDAPLFWIHLILGAAVLIGAVLLFVMVPDKRSGGVAVPSEPLRGHTLSAVIFAGTIWGLLNVGLGMFFGFGPVLLVERGWDLGAASAATSTVLWSAAVAIPLGGLLADRSGRHDVLMHVSFVGFAVVLVLVPMASSVTALFILAGIMGGVAAGPVMALPAQALAPGNRALGMGIFFALYYISMWIGPWMAGAAADVVGTAEAAFWIGAILMIVCSGSLAGFRRSLLHRAQAEANTRR